jgi:hypothetical protein
MIQAFATGTLLGKDPLVGHKTINNNAGHAILALARIGATQLPTNSETFASVTMNCLPYATILASEELYNAYPEDDIHYRGGWRKSWGRD